MSMSTKDIVLNNQEIRVKIINWIKTTRVQTAMVTALALWIGYVTVSPLSIRSAILLGGIGLLVHIWGFTLNEVEDYEYDARHGDVDSHPIAQGKVHKGVARYLAWVTAILAVMVSTLTSYSIKATIVLLFSFLPGYMYDKFSKKHWWSNFYLAIWAISMVIAGAIYAGGINGYTILIAMAVGIQIFVQVIEGDLKDIKGSENTFAEKLGVEVDTVEVDLYQSTDDRILQKIFDRERSDLIYYPNDFTFLVYGLKFIETMILISVAYLAVYDSSIYSSLYFALLLLIAAIFLGTVSMLLVYVFDRSELKKKASLHELTSIAFLGISVVGFDVYGGMLIAIAPIIWYLTVNHIVHSEMLNPDI